MDRAVYERLAGCGAEPSAIAGMVRIAADGHRQLCLGQGAELEWQRRRCSLSSIEVIDIFRRKTAPAFEVALNLGAAFAGEFCRPFHGAGISRNHNLFRRIYVGRFAHFALPGVTADVDNAIYIQSQYGCHCADSNRHGFLHVFEAGARRIACVRAILDAVDAPGRCRQLLEAYKEQAIRSLPELRNASLKGLLRRVIGKIFTLEVQGWCSEFETRNAADRQAVAESAR